MVCTKNKEIIHIDIYMRAIKIKLCRQNRKYKAPLNEGTEIVKLLIICYN